EQVVVTERFAVQEVGADDIGSACCGVVVDGGGLVRVFAVAQIALQWLGDAEDGGHAIAAVDAAGQPGADGCIVLGGAAEGGGGEIAPQLQGGRAVVVAQVVDDAVVLAGRSDDGDELVILRGGSE